MKVYCPDCQSWECTSIWKIQPDQLFAGKMVSVIFQETLLYTCESCHLRFKYPRMDVEFYNTLYNNESAETWNQLPQRYDQCEVLNYLNTLDTKFILDYGCYTWWFLSKINKGHILFGIEVNKKAADIAHETSGASIFPNIESLPKNQLFDVIVSMDVIEHMTSPKSFLQNLLELTQPHWEIIISTGDAENFLWKLHRSNWWYPSFNEHISFISESWLRHYSTILNFEIVHLEKYSYEKQSITSYLKYIIRILLIQSRLSEKFIQKFLFYDFKKNYIWLGVSNDHILLRIRKKAPN